MLVLLFGGFDGKFDLEFYGLEFVECFCVEDVEIFVIGKFIYCDFF